MESSCEVFVRPAYPYSEQYSRFILSEDDHKHFNDQYFHTYQARLASCRELLKESAVLFKHGKDTKIRSLVEVTEGETCMVTGTVYKHQNLKPCVLKELSDEANVMPQPILDKFVEDDDVLILEDNLQRVVLTNIDPRPFVTGVPLIVLGHEQEDGKFWVDDFKLLRPRDGPKPVPPVEDRYVAFVSGLGFTGEKDWNGGNLINLQLFCDWITGKSGNAETQEKVSKIVRLIVAGNSISEKAQDRTFSTRARYLTRKTVSGSLEAVKALDVYLAQIAASIDVDLMPGEFDPTNFLLPQQPLHKCMFSKASQFSTFHRATNPYEAEVEGFRILGTSGQSVDDIYKFSCLNDRLDIMEHTVRWGHICPSAPDTLGAHPYWDRDPFVLDAYPNIYFCGNQPTFGMRRYNAGSNKNVLLLSIPKFYEHSSCVLVNLRDLSVEVMSFAVDKEIESLKSADMFNGNGHHISPNGVHDSESPDEDSYMSDADEG